jgi:hypothetical protein
MSQKKEKLELCSTLQKDCNEMVQREVCYSFLCKKRKLHVESSKKEQEKPEYEYVCTICGMPQCECIISKTKLRCKLGCSKNPSFDFHFCHTHQPNKKQKEDIEKVSSNHMTPPKPNETKAVHLSRKIGSGTFGCVFRPPIKCFDNGTNSFTANYLNQKYFNNSNFVMKIRDTPQDEECAISDLVRKIDPHGDYFLPLTGDIATIDVNDSLLQQKVNFDLKNPGIRGYYSKYGGATLFRLCSSPTITKPSLVTIWSWFCYLLKGLQLLHSHGIYHFDMKADNIVISSHDKKPRIIDFGMAFDNIPKYKYNSCEYHPPFILAKSLEQDDKKLYKFVATLYKHFEYNMPRPEEIDALQKERMNAKKQITPSLSCPKLESNPLGYFLFICENEIDTFNNEILLKHREKLDLYQLMWSIWHLELFYDQGKTEEENQIREAIKYCFSKTMNPNVLLCWTLAELMEYVDQVNDELVLTKNQSVDNASCEKVD